MPQLVEQAAVAVGEPYKMPPERGQVFSFELELGSVGSSSSRTTSITRQYYLLLVISTASPPSAITSLASNKVRRHFQKLLLPMYTGK